MEATMVVARKADIDREAFACRWSLRIIFRFATSKFHTRDVALLRSRVRWVVCKLSAVSLLLSVLRNLYVDPRALHDGI